jgi:putative phosphoesterase
MNNLTFGIISDIHGDIDNLKAALNQCNQHKCNYILLLGDLLNHGPRNGLPSKYSPIEIVEELNKHKHKIISIKGNCDSEVDQMLLNFPIKSIYNQLFIGKHRIFMTHGHKYNETNMNELNLNKDDIDEVVEATMTFPEFKAKYDLPPWTTRKDLDEDGMIKVCSADIDQPFTI